MSSKKHDSAPVEDENKSSVNKYILDGICSSGMATLQGGVYITAFALALGASQLQVGLLASITFLSQLMQIPGLMLVNTYPKRKKIVTGSAVISRLLWIPIILIPFSAGSSPSILLLYLLLASLIGAIAAPAWNSLLRDILPQHRLGAINGKRIMLSTALAMILTLAGGYFISVWEGHYPQKELIAYSILFSVGLIFGILGVMAIKSIAEPKYAPEKLSIAELIKSPVRDKNFRSLMVFLSAWNLAINMSAPFFIVYIMNRLEYSVFFVTTLTVVSQIVNIIFLKLWGRLADKFSNKAVLSVSTPLFILTMILWNFTAMPYRHTFTIGLLFIIYIINGMAISGITLGTSSIALKLSPKDKAHSYMAVIGMLSAVMGAIAPLLGGLIAQNLDNIQLAVPLKLFVDDAVYSVPLMSFKGLDFVFILTVVIGIYAIHRLAMVKETGEGERKEVINELSELIISPIKSVSSITGLGKLATLPLNGLASSTKKAKKPNPQSIETEDSTE